MTYKEKYRKSAEKLWKLCKIRQGLAVTFFYLCFIAGLVLTEYKSYEWLGGLLIGLGIGIFLLIDKEVDFFGGDDNDEC